MQVSKILQLSLVLIGLSTVIQAQVANSTLSVCPSECIVPCVTLGLSNQCLARCGCTQAQANEQIQLAAAAKSATQVGSTAQATLPEGTLIPNIAPALLNNDVPVIPAAEPFTIFTYDGISYHIFSNGTTTLVNGTLVASEIGGFITYLRTLQALKTEAQYVITTENRTSTLSTTFMKDLQGNEYSLVGNSTSLTNLTSQLMVPIPVNISSTLQTINVTDSVITVYYDLVKDAFNGISYIVEKNGSVYTQINGHFVTDGGIQGLKEFLKVYYKVEGRLNGTQLVFPSIGNLTLQYSLNPFTAFKITGEAVCAEGTREELDFCIYRWLIQNYKYHVTDLVQNDYTVYQYSVAKSYRVYNNGIVTSNDANATFITTGGLQGVINHLIPQINADLNSQSYSVAKLSDGKTFNVYNSGVVTDAQGTIICQTGGNQCLMDYLQNPPIQPAQPQASAAGGYQVPDSVTQMVSTILESTGANAYMNQTGGGYGVGAGVGVTTPTTTTTGNVAAAYTASPSEVSAAATIGVASQTAATPNYMNYGATVNQFFPGFSAAPKPATQTVQALPTAAVAQKLFSSDQSSEQVVSEASSFSQSLTQIWLASILIACLIIMLVAFLTLRFYDNKKDTLFQFDNNLNEQLLQSKQNKISFDF